MNLLLPSFLIFLFFFAIFAHASTSSSCSDKCLLRLCNTNRAFIGAANSPVQDICSASGGVVSSIIAGEARISRRPFNLVARISDIEYEGVNPFKASFFRTIRRRNVTSLVSGEGSREAVQELHGFCVVLPVDRWQQGVTMERSGCLSFRVAVTKIVIQLSWTTNDDLDLFVVEPDGSEVFFANDSATGKLLRDVNQRSCSRSRRIGGTETVVYPMSDNIQNGVYKVFAEHSRSCDHGPTPWQIQVVVDGEVVMMKTGKSFLDDGGLIETSQLEFSI